jgi:GTP-binding protein HflX
MEKAILIDLVTSAKEKLAAAEAMDELAGLARAAGAAVVDRIIQLRPAPTPRFFLGSGKVEDLERTIGETGAEVLIFGRDLSPTQQRNLESALGIKVIDRTQLILDIFAQRARSSEGKLQVELAQLSYRLPRLVGRGGTLSRPGGGIGTRGPGETKLEVDRRRIQERITRIKGEIRSVEKRRAGQRRSREKSRIPLVALVGYTSVGKSTLFNRLAREKTWTSPQLFATLDPIVRRAAFPDGGPYFLSDTVGFIRRLPVALVTAFKATLEEVVGADAILHVIDTSAPDADGQREAVIRVLQEIGAGDIPRIDVHNKIDRLPDGSALLRRNGEPGENRVYVSALSGDGLAALRSRIAERATILKKRG